VKTVVLLAMHGVPPRDFPPAEMTEFFGLHARFEAGGHGMAPALLQRYRDLEARLRTWPRTSANDPFHAASIELAARLGREMGLETIVGFNEFCGPSLDEAFAEVAAHGAGRVIVVTPMLTQGGEHAERMIATILACRWVGWAHGRPGRAKNEGSAARTGVPGHGLWWKP
jgi:sirohydrochlorin cobaltochelatase